MIAIILAGLVLAAGRMTPAAWCGGGAVGVALLLGWRLGGRWLGVAGAALVPVVWWLVAPSSAVGAALLLTLWSGWWLMRFSDDPAPFNGIVAGCSLSTLVLMHRFGFFGALAAGTLLSNRRQSLARGWPWLASAGIGWWLAWRLA